VGLDQPLYDWQTKARALAAGLVRLPEPIEEVRHILGRDPHAGVGN
jgi:hypothetical protein